MYTAEFFDAQEGVLERIVLGMLASNFDADLQAKALFAGVQIRMPAVVGYRVLNNDGVEVARSRFVHA